MEMGIKKLWEKIRGNPIDRIDERVLREEEIRLKNEANRIRDRITKLEKEKANLFDQGIGKDNLTKAMLIQEMETCDMEGKLNFRNFTTTQKQLRFTRNLLVIKKYEKQLKKEGIWKKLSSIPASDLERYLIELNLEGKTYDEVLDSLIGTFRMEVAEVETTISEASKNVIKAWEDVEKGILKPEEAKEKLSIQKTLEKEGEKG